MAAYRSSREEATAMVLSPVDAVLWEHGERMRPGKARGEDRRTDSEKQDLCADARQTGAFDPDGRKVAPPHVAGGTRGREPPLPDHSAILRTSRRWNPAMDYPPGRFKTLRTSMPDGGLDPTGLGLDLRVEGGDLWPPCSTSWPPTADPVGSATACRASDGGLGRHRGRRFRGHRRWRRFGESAKLIWGGEA